MQNNKVLYAIVVLIIVLLIVWNNYSNLKEKYEILDAEIQQIDSVIDGVNAKLTKEKNKNEELSSDIIEIKDDLQNKTDQIQDLLKENEKYRAANNRYKNSNEILENKIFEYRQAEIENTKNELIKDLKKGLSQEEALVILGDDYHEVQGADYPAWRFDLLTNDQYMYSNNYDELDIAGMMSNKVGIVVFVNWTDNNKVWYYTIYYRNLKENSIWEYRVFADNAIRESEIHKEN